MPILRLWQITIIIIGRRIERSFRLFSSLFQAEKDSFHLTERESEGERYIHRNAWRIIENVSLAATTHHVDTVDQEH